MNNLDVVKALFDAINADDKDEMMALFADDAVFENVPMGEVKGKTAIWELLAPIHEVSTGVDWKVHRLEEAPSGTVYSERTDQYQIKGQWTAFRCAGIHEVNDEGKITLWRDYFDLKQCMDTIPK